MTQYHLCISTFEATRCHNKSIRFKHALINRRDCPQRVAHESGTLVLLFPEWNHPKFAPETLFQFLTVLKRGHEAEKSRGRLPRRLRQNTNQLQVDLAAQDARKTDDPRAEHDQRAGLGPVGTAVDGNVINLTWCSFTLTCGEVVDKKYTPLPLMTYWLP